MTQISILLYLGGLFSLVIGLYYVLNMLMSLEFMMLSLFMLLLVYCVNMEFELIIVYMVFSVCEASLGLALMVIGVMMGGNKYYSSFDVLKW